MSEKKVKQLRKEQDDIVAEFRIVATKNGEVKVFGPIDNILGFFDVMNRAQRAVLNHFAQQKNNRIIVPEMKVHNG